MCCGGGRAIEGHNSPVSWRRLSYVRRTLCQARATLTEWPAWAAKRMTPGSWSFLCVSFPSDSWHLRLQFGEKKGGGGGMESVVRPPPGSIHAPLLLLLFCTITMSSQYSLSYADSQDRDSRYAGSYHRLSSCDTGLSGVSVVDASTARLAHPCRPAEKQSNWFTPWERPATIFAKWSQGRALVSG